MRGVEGALPTRFLRIGRKPITSELWELVAILVVISGVAMLRYRQTLD